MKTHWLTWSLILAVVSPLLVACGSAYEPPVEEPEAEEAVSPVSLALTGVASNAKWTSYIEKFDGVPMALVPAGCFMMGSESGYSNEVPVHEQCFEEPFWIDVYEVTNAQFGSLGCSDYSSADNQPRNCVSWLDAAAYCEKRGARLPTEAEWEYAARGPDGLVYPWANEFVADNVVYYGNSGGQTAEVGSRPSGASWVGALDMSGNVWEWVSSIYRDYPYDATDGREVDGNSDSTSPRVLRGGSWCGGMNGLPAVYREWGDPDRENLGAGVGFRCARDF